MYIKMQVLRMPPDLSELCIHCNIEYIVNVNFNKIYRIMNNLFVLDFN